MTDIIAKAYAYRKMIEDAAQYLPDEKVQDSVRLFPVWDGSGVSYEAGTKVSYRGVVYKVLTAHVSQAGWTPTAAPSLFAEVLTDPDRILPWKQPDSTNPYAKSDKVTHSGFTWISDVDGNVWEPGTYGWSKIE